MADDGTETPKGGKRDNAGPPIFADETRLVGHVKTALAALGFSEFSLFADEGNRNVRGTFCRTVPDQWQKNYIRKRYYPIDPVVQRLRIATAPFRWSDLDIAGMTPKQRDLFEAARGFNYHNGVAVPLRLPDEELVAFVAYTAAAVVPDDVVPQVAAIARTCLAGYIALRGGKLPNRQALSPREEEVLVWAARGKSNGEIATILHLKDKTIEYHWPNIRRKLGASNRTMAVAIAVDSSLIQP